MTEIPEHLLKRAQAARDKAAAGEPAAEPAAAPATANGNDFAAQVATARRNPPMQDAEPPADEPVTAAMPPPPAAAWRTRCRDNQTRS